MSLIHMALAFVVNHPAVTAAIIGPAPVNNWRASSARLMCASTMRYSTESTRSSPREQTSVRKTLASHLQRSPTPPCAAADSRARRRPRRPGPQNQKSCGPSVPGLCAKFCRANLSVSKYSRPRRRGIVHDSFGWWRSSGTSSTLPYLGSTP